MVPGYTKETLTRAKELRRTMTDAEKKLWAALRDRRLSGHKFRKQQPIGPYIVDFVCQEHGLIVEADGSQHFDNDYDVRRDTFLESTGYRVLRFWNNDILNNMRGVADAILLTLSAPHPSAASRLPPSPSRGEGLFAQ
jgi:very-short-patch-repair endonuclease